MREIDTLTVRRLAIAGAMTVIAAAPAHAALMTYYMSIENQSGSVGGTSFSNATIHLQYTGDTNNIVGGSGSSAEYTMTGDAISFTITGGNVASDITGTFSSGENWSFGSNSSNGYWFFKYQHVTQFSSTYYSAFGFKAPSGDQTAGASTTFASGSNMLTSAYSQTVTGYPDAGSGTLDNTIGAALPFSNWVIFQDVGSSIGTFTVTQSGTDTFYNGSFGIPYTPSAVPGAGLAGLATIGLAGVSRQRRR